MPWLTAIAIPVVIVLCWILTARVQRESFPTLRGKKICLLIAHPDDEAMFFAPSLLALTRPELGNHVKILCLSSGNADGLGQIRSKELVQSGILLGLLKADDVLVIEQPEFQDSITGNWSAHDISVLLSKAFAPNIKKSPSKSAPQTTIDVLITFDKDGVSAHPNHISLYHGGRAFVSTLMRHHPGWACPIALYTLTSTSIMRKYTSFLDALVTMISCALLSNRKIGPAPNPLVFINTPLELGKAQKAMTTAHKSQMRWFRYGWIWASRYMIVNDLRLEKVL
ncbi:MAG: N-acetylglucosaminyl-phosphatidylinositol de-N-acetylase [Trizodia sp. TS-e1964]|nr:MAG: N-acetylglucosaminyl-phosphatidylinositol de-N-acetylase [Trizodia sp. TS-e1964]